jgi:hypothetical protein
VSRNGNLEQKYRNGKKGVSPSNNFRHHAVKRYGEVEVQRHALNWALDGVISFKLRTTYNKENDYREPTD